MISALLEFLRVENLGRSKTAAVRSLLLCAITLALFALQLGHGWVATLDETTQTGASLLVVSVCCTVVYAIFTVYKARTRTFDVFRKVILLAVAGLIPPLTAMGKYLTDAPNNLVEPGDASMVGLIFAIQFFLTAAIFYDQQP